MPKRVSLDEEVLIAAADLEASGHCPFSAEALVVAAWNRFPDSFSLEGYPQYPDSNRVLTKIMGRKGLRGRGWLIKVGEKRYQLSEAGRFAAKTLVTHSGSEVPFRAVLSRDQKRLIERLLFSRVVVKLKANDAESIGFHDACSFWDISPRSSASTLEARLQSVEALINAVENVVSKHGNLVLTRGGPPIGSEEAGIIRKAHQILLDRFDTDLKFIRRRADERKFK